MTTISAVWNTAKQQCLDLDMKPSVGNAKKLIKRGGRSVKDAKNYVARQAFVNIADKPYTNEFGEQEALGSICDRNMEYAERFVEKNMAKFQGGVNNMTDATLYIMRRQREQLDTLTSEGDKNVLFKSRRKS